MKLEIDLCFKSKKWPNHAIQKIKPMLKLVTLEALKTIKASDLCKTLAFSLLFVSDIEMKKYNSKFKDKACATNVLSFPAENFLKTDLTNFKREYLYLGEIIFSFETIKKESAQQRKIFNEHLLHLFTHAFLHLLCYVHKTKKDRERMEKLEILILKKFGIKNPYEIDL